MELAYIFGSVIVVSLISLVGVFTLGLRHEFLDKILIYFVSFSAGALLGDAFIHLLPEIVAENGMTLQISLTILGGILMFFILEKFLHWQHCHGHGSHHHHTFAWMNIIGDGLHNFIDGMVIAASYIVSIPVGVATTLAVILHEIPQEIGNFAVLLHAGFSKKRALFLNFISALTALLGAAATILLANIINHIEIFLIPITIGGFVYIAGSDLIPETHKHAHGKAALLNIFAFVIGIAVMGALLFLE